MSIQIEIHVQIKVETKCVITEAGSSPPLVTIQYRERIQMKMKQQIHVYTNRTTCTNKNAQKLGQVLCLLQYTTRIQIQMKTNMEIY